MIKRYAKLICLLLILLPGVNRAQNTLIYFNDFEQGSSTVILNDSIFGNYGPNRWIINSQYIGMPVFPNTISEDSTLGGFITHPDSNYLHIYDSQVATVSNANFDPNDSSDRFTVLGPFCTQGFDSVHVAFFYLYGGNVTSQAQLYYSVDGGVTWALVPGGTFSNTSKWKYEDITDTAFSNITNLEFGFRWISGVSSDTATSFGIDDIKLVATYDPVKYPVKITIQNIFDAPVCAGSQVLFDYSISIPLCGQGLYDYQLLPPFGPKVDLGTLQLSNEDLFQFIFSTIPANMPADSCYRIRIVRTDITPNIVSDTSPCFAVVKCPAVINTGEPVAISNLQDTICLGSAIDVPFTSSGAFLPNNVYIAQLSDSSGNFPSSPNIIGTFPSAEQFSFPPGTVSGMISAGNHPVPAGCGYFIRIISTSPADTGSAYGPFCIRDCDIETNNLMNIQVCVTQTTGDSLILPIHINTYDSSEVYSANDTFELQVLSMMDFSIINTGGLGYIVSDTSTVLHLYIPGVTGLAALGLAPGEYYLRIVATNSNELWNTHGTLIHLTIGFPNPTPITVLYYNTTTGFAYPLPDTTICTGGVLFYEVDPYNPTSSYQWTLDGNHNWSNGPSTGIIFNGTGLNVLSVIETNYGCVGPGSDTAVVNVIGEPPVNIIGKSQVCLGDTLSYSVPLQDETYYKWTSTTTVLDTANNNLTVTFPKDTVEQIYILAVGVCGADSNSLRITVKPYPIVNAGNDTTVCVNNPVTLSTTTGPYTYLWSTGAKTNSITVTPGMTTTYSVSSKVIGPAGCTSTDTVTVFVKTPVTSEVTDSLSQCPGTAALQLQADTANLHGTVYIWNDSARTATISVNNTGVYTVTITYPDSICYETRQFQVVDKSCPVIPARECITNVMTLNKDGRNETWGLLTNNDSCAVYNVLSAKIFDRWGVLMYESAAGGLTQWDGKNKSGNTVPDGVYYYEVTVDTDFNSAPQSLRGYITVLK